MIWPQTLRPKLSTFIILLLFLFCYVAAWQSQDFSYFYYLKKSDQNILEKFTSLCLQVKVKHVTPFYLFYLITFKLYFQVPTCLSQSLHVFWSYIYRTFTKKGIDMLLYPEELVTHRVTSKSWISGKQSPPH